VAIDRVATLRNAEKLLRQGKLAQAIAEYVRVVEDQPHDWNTANTLGDLYVRGGQIEKAVEQFVRQPFAAATRSVDFPPQALATTSATTSLRAAHISPASCRRDCGHAKAATPTNAWNPTAIRVPGRACQSSTPDRCSLAAATSVSVLHTRN